MSSSTPILTGSPLDVALLPFNNLLTPIEYTYDNANRLTNIQQGTSTIIIGYDDADHRTSVTYPNTNKVEYGYNVASELETVTYKQGTTTLGTLTYEKE